jgi:NADPH:quinone reductase-like Zn-dependent oxidoreductase
MDAAFVVSVCSSKNEKFVRKCGADDVLAYDRTSIQSIASRHLEWEGRFDLIFDAVGIDEACTVLVPQLASPAGRWKPAKT